MKLSIVVPVYNEEESLEILAEALNGLTRLLKTDFEVIFVDDHSTDRTPEKLRILSAEQERFKSIRLSKNSGSHIAIIAGLSVCQGDCAVFLSADLQDPPEVIGQLLEEWKKGRQVVWAVREKREGIGLFERATSKIFHVLFNSMSSVKQPPQGGSDFALLDRKVIDAVIHSARPNLNINPLIMSRGFDAAYVPYVKRQRQRGRSKWTLSKKIKNFIDAFVGYSYIPLRLISASGIIVSILGVGYAAFLAYRTLVLGVKTPEGWSEIMVFMLILNGMQMTMLGVLGEYLWRTFEAARNTPLFFIQDSFGFRCEDQNHQKAMETLKTVN